MKVRTILDSPVSIDEHATINGFLRVTGDGRCFLSDAEHDDNAAVLEIEDDRLYDNLIDSVPCMVGGQFLYDDRATVDAVLSCNEGVVVISTVNCVEIERREKKFTISVTSK